MEAHLIHSIPNLLAFTPLTGGQTYLLLQRGTLSLLDGQTLRRHVETPLFEGVQAEDSRYYLLHHQQHNALVIYPNNVIVEYSVDTLDVIRVVQSLYNIVCPCVETSGKIIFME